MLKIIAKLTGLIALTMTVITAVLDLTRSIANSALTITALGEEWFNFHLPSLNGLQVGVQRKLDAPWLWESVIQNILLAPS